MGVVVIAVEGLVLEEIGLVIKIGNPFRNFPDVGRLTRLRSWIARLDI